jgi:uncharacterized protein (DUF927 family)
VNERRILSELGQAALGYARQGWPVFPCDPKSKKPLVPRDKDEHGKPIDGTGGLYKATTDEAQIMAWWSKLPSAMVGVATGERAGVWALDPDVDERTGANGLEELVRLQDRYGAIPETVTTQTPRGGSHLLFRWDPERPVSNAQGRIPKSINVRGNGGYIVLPPSKRADGRAYEWRRPPEQCDYADAPGWLYALLAKDEAADVPRERYNGTRIISDYRRARYAQTALYEIAREVAAAPPGTRNEGLNAGAYRLGRMVARGWIERTIVEHRLFEAATASGLAKDDGASSVRNTIASGLRAGLEKPADDPPVRDPPEHGNGRADDTNHLGPNEEVEFDWPFRITPHGVEKRIVRVNKDTGDRTEEWKWFCSPLTVGAETRNPDGEEWGRLLRITDRDGRVKEWAMPMSMLAGDGNAYREQLLSLGLIMAPGKFARDALHEYISTARPKVKARCVGRIGWHNKTYVRLHRNFGEHDGAEKFILQTTGAVDHAYRESGALEGWQTDVARYAIGNSRLGLALSAAFAAPLLYPTFSESGGIHLRGPSSTGKTTALVVAGSVWGGGGVRGFLRPWRATSNGLEGVAALHCDALLCLDEMGQVDGREAGQIAYMLANGIGKARASRSGEARPPAEWRVLFLSSGELALGDKIAEDGRGRRAAAGQQVRIVEISADTGAGFGLFEDLHGYASGDALARHLKTASGEHYGVASNAFLEFLTRDLDAIVSTVLAHCDEFVRENCPADADGQVARVAARFGLITAAGEVATAFGILPWPSGEATRSAARCFRDWLGERGGIEPAEVREGIAAVRRYIELHGASRFEPISSLAPTTGYSEPIDQRIQNRVGFKRSGANGRLEYLFLPEAWKSEVCRGLDVTQVTKALADRGMLIRGKDRLQSQHRLPGFANPQWCYLVTEGLFEDGPAGS